MSTDNSVTTVEVIKPHVHAASLSTADSALLANHFTHDTLDGGTAWEEETMATVSSDDVITRDEGCFSANVYGFLKATEH